ncbi:DNA-binding GntR family transcriptional regulator [Lysinibacillus composti]|uniref:GntR family transcriptional regulator n=1 Tax=Lysinibacillus composti TaxID=720633 RepID=A0A3N9UDS0_9BACI|nr:GntR family transcriptional regulator [Lysinibacillus composti]MBM7608904.1 DNA-binding GntR family transcriptional regulator [Lysinibacillus composti]RQW74483.1 GntR family transcriptional regulator [Lysinibacillus composti]
MVRKVREKEFLADQATRILREGILSGELLPGEELPEEKIATQLGISRTPLRDALRRLQLEGLLIIEKGRPAKVSNLTPEDFFQSLEIRQIIETYNIEYVTSHINDHLFEKLKDNILQQELATIQTNYNHFLELDREFHILLASASPNSKLIHLIHEMNTGTYRAFNYFVSDTPKTTEHSLQEHIEILDAIQEKDSTLARQKMQTHLEKVGSRLKDVLVTKTTDTYHI